MLSALNYQLSVVEQTLSRHRTLLARLRLVDFERRLSYPVASLANYPLTPRTADSTATYEQQDNDVDVHRQVDKLYVWVRRLRVRITRTLRRVDRLRAQIARHEILLEDIRSRLILSYGGLALVRPHAPWSASSRCDMIDNEMRQATAFYRCSPDNVVSSGKQQSPTTCMSWTEQRSGVS
jgi:hypothetical protein